MNKNSGTRGWILIHTRQGLDALKRDMKCNNLRSIRSVLLTFTQHAIDQYTLTLPSQRVGEKNKLTCVMRDLDN